jgi:S-(hydroxymethyl)glutathione dehydrogenase/alcohol dehydrogenase
MRAAVLTEINKPLQILDLEQEPPKSKEVRVRVKAAGVCMSDWHIMNGDWPLPLPMVLGHEAAGIVVENGPEVDNIRPGDHVIFSSGRIAGGAAIVPPGRPCCASGTTTRRAGACMTGRPASR